jgi:lysophospholipid acyltransferase (LPLAT)-like uncharacterized protein
MHKRILSAFLGFLAGIAVRVWRWSVRIRVVDDPRPALKEAGRRYVYAIPHAHQLSFLVLSDDRPVAAMVSASTDGDIVAGACRARGVTPVRGSSRKKGKDKGGKRALDELGELLETGVASLLAVDGPRGPRGMVHWGVVNLARRYDACIVVAGIFPSRKSILKRTWDRTQIPLPFCRLTGRFRPPVDPRDFPEDDQALRDRVRDELAALELEWDPYEANLALENAAAQSAAAS